METFPAEDHPRRCREHIRIYQGLASCKGSSPRMRGAHSDCLRRLLTNRIIPAGAGSTVLAAACPAERQDHPRGCGEHHGLDDGLRVSVGSSPRMRGSTGRSSPRWPWCPDHPRGCGEHQCLICWSVPTKGSSPRMRGARCRRLLGWSVPGIIPADAGSAVVELVHSRSGEDHPRGCGEHVAPGLLLGLIPGSSLRMRGARPS